MPARGLAKSRCNPVSCVGARASRQGARCATAPQRPPQQKQKTGQEAKHEAAGSRVARRGGHSRCTSASPLMRQRVKQAGRALGACQVCCGRSEHVQPHHPPHAASAPGTHQKFSSASKVRAGVRRRRLATGAAVAAGSGPVGPLFTRSRPRHLAAIRLPTAAGTSNAGDAARWCGLRVLGAALLVPPPRRHS